MTAQDKEVFAAMVQSELDALTAPTTTLETVRELHVLYGIAMTNRYMKVEPAICDVYDVLAAGIHVALFWIVKGCDVATELGRLVDKLNEEAADSSDDDRVAALYGSWAQNIKSIT